MTTEEKRWVLGLYCQTQYCDEDCPLHGDVCKCGRGYHFEAAPDEKAYMTDDEITAAFDMVFPDTPTDPTPVIKDSGERRQFDTGAVRDIQEGKGRCDLMPLDVVAWVLGCTDDVDAVLNGVQLFTTSGNIMHLYDALEYFRNLLGVDFPTMFLEVAKHFEEGAKKYGEHNWQKGIPVKCYIDSAVRHYLKYQRGDKDEPHDRAFCWNILCAIWTCKHMPELNDYKEN